MKKLAALILFFLCFASLTFGISKQDKVKGLLIERLSSFITWPASESKNFNIAVYNDESLAKGYESLYKNHKRANTPIAIASLSNGIDTKTLNNIDILFIKNATDKSLLKLLKELSKRPILTISDDNNLINKGVMINLSSQGGKIQFIIDHSALNSANLKASYRLLKLAKIINPVKEQ